MNLRPVSHWTNLPHSTCLIKGFVPCASGSTCRIPLTNQATADHRPRIRSGINLPVVTNTPILEFFKASSSILLKLAEVLVQQAPL